MGYLTIHTAEFGLGDPFLGRVDQLLSTMEITSGRVVENRLSDNQTRVRGLKYWDGHHDIGVFPTAGFPLDGPRGPLEGHFQPFIAVLGIVPNHLEEHQGFLHTIFQPCPGCPSGLVGDGQRDLGDQIDMVHSGLLGHNYDLINFNGPQ